MKDGACRPARLRRAPGLWIVLVVALVLAAVVAIVEFPGSAAATAVGWLIYLFLGLAIRPWGQVLLALGAAIAAILWTLTRPVE